uniref:Tr-type G domain-containing protein n=1 Tax=Romanomermis culicivorax TaxID=13658 RepID=A0A915L2T3_ROMCU
MSGLNPNAAVFIPRFGGAPAVPEPAPVQIHPAPTAPVENVKETTPVSQDSGVVDVSTKPTKISPAKESEDSWEDLGEEEKETATEHAQSRKEKAAPLAPKIKKEHVNVIFIGHVDAGKSTIGGQLMYVTGQVDKRTLEKYEREAKEMNRESWYLSWALDTNVEEREKGKTVQVGRASFETDRKHFTILDAPGHKSFVPNMIGGASQADLAVLVISARKGEFEAGLDRGGQTREHAMLVKTAGVRHLIVLINKMDDSTVNWDKKRFDEAKDKLLPVLKKVGFVENKDLYFMPCSGFTGPPFIEYLDNLPPLSRAREGAVRVVLSDKYNDMGTVVMGKVESGVVTRGQNLLLMPNKTLVQALQLWSDDDETDEIGPGENVKIKLKGVEEDAIMSGFVLCSVDNYCKVGRVFDAQ